MGFDQKGKGAPWTVLCNTHHWKIWEKYSYSEKVDFMSILFSARLSPAKSFSLKPISEAITREIKKTHQNTTTPIIRKIVGCYTRPL